MNLEEPAIWDNTIIWLIELFKNKGNESRNLLPVKLEKSELA